MKPVDRQIMNVVRVRPAAIVIPMGHVDKEVWDEVRLKARGRVRPVLESINSQFAEEMHEAPE